MIDLEELIRFENECSYLDFKAQQYRPEKHADLLKDVMALANARTDGDRYIVIGVDAPPNAERRFLGVPLAELIDAAIWQQLVAENIEPHLDIEYSPFTISDKVLGVIRIPNPSDPPYMMKKDFSVLRRGDAFVRKGSFQARMTRADLDRIHSSKQRAVRRVVEPRLGFDAESYSDRLVITTAPADYETPYERAKREIDAAIATKESAEARGIPSYGRPQFFEWVPYAERSLQDLRKARATVEKTYAKSSLYDIFEKHGYLLNAWLLNPGTEYLEDVSISLELPFIEGRRLFVADQIHAKPRHDPFGISTYPEPLQIGYPDVEQLDDRWKITAHIGNLRHQVPVRVFQEPVRIFVGQECAGKTVQIAVTIFGKQVEKPITRQLILDLVAPNEASHREGGST